HRQIDGDVGFSDAALTGRHGDDRGGDRARPGADGNHRTIRGGGVHGGAERGGGRGRGVGGRQGFSDGFHAWAPPRRRSRMKFAEAAQRSSGTCCPVLAKLSGAPERSRAARTVPIATASSNLVAKMAAGSVTP